MGRMKKRKIWTVLVFCLTFGAVSLPVKADTVEEQRNIFIAASAGTRAFEGLLKAEESKKLEGMDSSVTKELSPTAKELSQRLLTAEEGEEVQLYETVIVDVPLTLEGNGAVLTRGEGFDGPMFYIGGQGSLEIGSLVLDGRGSGLSGSLMINEGSLTIHEGCILRNNHSENGGAVYSTGRLMIEGGVFTGNRAEFHGGAVWSGGYLEMNGGSIYGNRAEGNGGGFYCDYGNFMLMGGRVEGNDALCGGYDLYSQYKVLYEPGVINPSRCYGDLERYGGEASGSPAFQDNGKMWFESMPSNTSFIVGGYDSQGGFYSLTYADYGFEAFLQTSEQPMALIQTGPDEEKEVLNGLAVSQSLEFAEDGSGVEVSYRIRNISDESQCYSLGIGGDVQADADQHTVVYRNYHGFTIEDTRTKEVAKRPCFQILCRNRQAAADADARWLGGSEEGTYYHNLFADSPDILKAEEADTLLAFSWQDRTLGPGEEETIGFTIRLTTMGQQWKEHAEGLILRHMAE